MSGGAELHAPGGAWQPLHDGQHVAVGAVVRTAPDGRVVLTRGDESVTIAPSSSFEFKPASDSMLTSIFQKAGTLMFKVHKRPSKHFEVRTPYFVAIVKGTTFTVSVDAAGSAAHVIEGLVEVTSLSAAEKILLHPGQTGSIRSAPGSKLQYGAAAPQKDDSAAKKKARGPVVKQAIESATVDIEEASQGLIKNERTHLATQTAGVANGVGAALGGAAGGGSGAGGSGAGGSVGGTLTSTVGGLQDGLGGAVSGVGGAVTTLSSGVGSTVSGLSGGVGGAVGSVGGSVGGVVSGVGGSVGGALGGIGGALGSGG